MKTRMKQTLKIIMKQDFKTNYYDLKKGDIVDVTLINSHNGNYLIGAGYLEAVPKEFAEPLEAKQR